MNLLNNEIYASDIQKILSTFDITPFNQKKILITGGAGLIGASIADLFLYAIKASLIRADIFIADLSKESFYEKFGLENNITFIPFDALSSFTWEQPFDYVIMAAGIASPQNYVKLPMETAWTSINGVMSFLPFFQKQIGKYVYISSSEVYEDGLKPHSEDEPTRAIPSDLRFSYAFGKIATEQFCQYACREYGSHILIARPGHIFGPRASEQDTRVSSAFCRDAALGRDITLKSDGMSLRSYCYSLDCAVAILTILLRGKPGEIYNVGTSEKTTILELAKMISFSGGVSLLHEKPLATEERVFNPAHNSSLNVEKLYDIGFQHCFTVQEGIDHNIKIWRGGR